MQAEAIAHPMDQTPDDDLRLGVATANPRHPLASLLWGQNVHQRCDASRFAPREAVPRERAPNR